ncbi:hypothetical protein [uncultured Chryseobacterium sp.]|uniref:hypothetical protein n=1 Tax=uncultured Chryseobacterium sp. TaxID=259322 RepID=UPI0025D73530|nr:hypothetical protein [uncultured Chryseobacterium sp.]
MNRKLFLMSVLLLLAMGKISAQSQVYIDVLAGHKGLTSEFFFLEPIDKEARWTVISRSEMHLPEYKTEHPGFVNYNIFAYNFKNHFGITAGTYATSHYPFSARLGVQYLRESEKWLVYANLSTAVTKDPDAQMLVVLGYLPELSEKWRLVTRLEARTAINYENGHAFSTQQLKLGAQYNEKIGFGIGLEVEEHGKSSHKDFNIGPFLRVNF